MSTSQQVNESTSGCLKGSISLICPMGLIGPIGRKGLLGSVIWGLEVLTSWWGK